jgi:serine/threonine protein kinase/Tfp pilus assembly protein PilF
METQKPEFISNHPVMIGRYRILRLLGEGGMGSVYLAEQANSHWVVALKVIRPGCVDSESLHRFEQEAQVLGRLHHPGIAHIYEAGTADSALGPQPYFAMELIEGLSLREFAEVRRLKARARLELMAKICDAVDHAHQHSIIHRDLKPGNILIDESGQPKVLDFGIARLTDSDVKMTRQTDIGQVIGTLNYMSPEQALADPQEELDIRSDVYALGVITYELLSGRLPYDTARKPLHEVVRAIREQDPVPLSSIQRIYQGDIATIVAKALEKDKARRYASAAELAADIRRYLNGEPIVARPPSTGYQLRKLARRHWALVAGAAAVLLVLTAGVVVSTWEAVRARRAEASANAINDFLQNDLLTYASTSNLFQSNAEADPDLTMRTALDRAAARIGGKFDKQPEVEASIRDTIGMTYLDLGLGPEARKQLELALDLHRRVDGAQNPKTLNTEWHLRSIAGGQSTYAEAEALLSQTTQTMRRVLGPEHPDTLKAMNALATVYSGEGKYAQAGVLLSQILEIDRRTLGPDHPDTLKSAYDLAVVYNRDGKLAMAEALQSQTLEARRRVLGPEHPDTVQTMIGLADVYDREGKYAQAESLLNRTQELDRRIWGPEYPNTLQSRMFLANVYNDEGRHAQAEPILTQVLEIDRRALGPDNLLTVRCMYYLGIAYSGEGKYAQAEALLSRAVEINSRVLGPEHRDTLWYTNGLATTYDREGKYAQAEALFSQALEVERRVLGPTHPVTLMSRNGLADVYIDESKYGLAETYAAQALTGRKYNLGPDHPDTMVSMNDLVLAYELQGKFTESEPLARETEKIEQAKQPDDWQRFWAESLLGESLAGEKRYAEAEPLLLEGYRGMLARKERTPVPSRRHLDSAHGWIIELYEAWGKPQKAAEWRHT